ncbi:MAG: hypothetical protein KDA85_14020 [Planctomycetaceae bacterium]|nr:hypothetical protein [Planctomycetaceae bacterium]
MFALPDNRWIVVEEFFRPGEVWFVLRPKADCFEANAGTCGFGANELSCETSVPRLIDYAAVSPEVTKPVNLLTVFRDLHHDATYIGSPPTAA